MLYQLEKSPDRRRILAQGVSRTCEDSPTELTLRQEHNPVFNFLYGVMTSKPCAAEEAIQTLQDWPWDMMHWLGGVLRVYWEGVVKQPKEHRSAAFRLRWSTGFSRGATPPKPNLQLKNRHLGWHKLQVPHMLVPTNNAHEAAVAEKVDIIPVSTLANPAVNCATVIQPSPHTWTTSIAVCWPTISSQATSAGSNLR